MLLRRLFGFVLAASVSAPAFAEEQGKSAEGSKPAPTVKQEEPKKGEPKREEPKPAAAAPKNEEPKKHEPKKEEPKREPVKVAAKTLVVPDWVPKQFNEQTTQRLAQIQADLDSTMAKLRPAREEADKARSVANQAEHKVADLERFYRWLETERQAVLNGGHKQLRDNTLDKRDFENEQKIARLEGQVRELTSKLDAAAKRAQEAKQAPKLEAKPAVKHEAKK